MAKALKENGKDSEAYTALTDLRDQVDDLMEFYDGLCDYCDAVQETADGAYDLLDGANELAGVYDGKDNSSGLGKLYDGTLQLKDGTTEFMDRMDTIDTEITDEADRVIAEKTGKNVAVSSFTSPKNGLVDSVQFVISIPAIEAPEEEEEPVVEEEKTSFIDKIGNLFHQ